jgi:hypothetical protein
LVAAIGDVYLWFLTVSGRDGRLLVVVQKFGKLSRQRHHRLALDAGLAQGDLRLPGRLGAARFGRKRHRGVVGLRVSWELGACYR